MNKLEQLEQEAFDKNVKVHNYYLGEADLKGLYMDGNIALNTSLSNSTETACTMAEEMGHHETTVGDITNQSSLESRKQERQARFWAYNRYIGLKGLISAYEFGCKSRYEIAAYLEVTEEFLQDCIDCYSAKYGVGKTVDNYYIMFIPHLIIGKMIS